MKRKIRDFYLINQIFMSIFFNIVLKCTLSLIICFLSRLSATIENRVILVSRSVPKVCFSAIVPDSEATAVQRVPTGLSSVPPSGPAIPEVATAIIGLKQAFLLLQP